MSLRHLAPGTENRPLAPFDRGEGPLGIRPEPIRFVEHLWRVTIVEDHPLPDAMTFRTGSPSNLRRVERFLPQSATYVTFRRLAYGASPRTTPTGALICPGRVRSIGESATWGAVCAHVWISPRPSLRHLLTTWSLRNWWIEGCRPWWNENHSPRACSPSPVESAAPFDLFREGHGVLFGTPRAPSR